ncbi:MAG: GntR family transcriptional regulator [Treponemataceae bacterium]|nr:GntR family transcriptional regulator [Treponemataceae bacterium]
MAWNLDSDRPIFAQIIERIKLDIVSGVYKPGDKLPSVRDLASEAAVNPNTMQKAFAELERDGLVYSQRTSGRFISEDIAMIEELRASLARGKMEELVGHMKKLGFSNEDMVSLLKSILEEKNK